MAEIVLRYPEVLIALPIIWLLLVLFAVRRRFKPFGPFLLRLLIVVLVILGLSQPVIPTVNEAEAELLQQPIVLLVDQSASLTSGEQQTLRAEAERLAQEFPQAETLYFADHPLMPAPSVPPVEGEVEAEANNNLPASDLPLNEDLSNLAEALMTGAEMLAGPGRLVLLSDGVPTVGQIDLALDHLARRNVAVDVLVWNDGEREPVNDVRLVELNVPPVLREGEVVDVELIIHAATAMEVKLDLTQDTNPLAESVIPLDPGINRFSYETDTGAVGPHTFRATIAPVDIEDGRPANNVAAAFTQVYAQPTILVVGDESGPIEQMRGWLGQAGFTTASMNPGQLPVRLSELEPYAGMVMINVSARALEFEQMIAVQEFVRSLGRGLLVTGGRNSFSLGEYEDTPLANILPLSLEPPPRKERPPVALLLVLDHSGSMGEPREPATSLDMAKEAVIRATDILGPDDLIGILMFDNRYEWVVEFQPAEDGAALLSIQSQIATIPPGGGTRILPALETGLLTLAEQDTLDGPRHAILFSDGKSFDGDKGIDDYNALVDFALESDITLSTIAIGDEADRELLTHLAEKGLGRYHDAAVPDDLPALTIAESDILRSDAVQEGDFLPALFAPHPMIRGFATLSADTDCAEAPCPEEISGLNIPNLTGYIGMTPKPRSEIALQAGPGDPLLAVWGYGLGRVAAWSSDTGDEWGQSMTGWPEVARFWGQVLGYTLPAPNLGLLQVDVDIDPEGIATLAAEGVTSTGALVDLETTTGTLTTPGGREVPLTLKQVAPGRYEQKVRLVDPGAYQLTVTQTREDEPEETVTVGFVMPYPEEYALSEAETLGSPLLREIAETTGGRTFSLGQSLLDCDPETNDCQPATPVEADQADEADAELIGIDLWPWLLLAALLLWPLEIALRRLGRLRIQ